MFGLWLVVIGCGVAALWVYEQNPGDSQATPQRWPTDSQVSVTHGKPILVTVLHPRCSCSRATLEELSYIMARNQDRLDAVALFVCPAGAGEGWEQTPLWRAAAAIPGVRVKSDARGAEAMRLGAMTSGQCVLYDEGGSLLFQGGITAGRGHFGDSVGRSAILRLLDSKDAPVRQTPVFGCPLLTSPVSQPQAERG